MVKLRMTTADVAAEVACLRRMIGFRVANVYDLNPKGGKRGEKSGNEERRPGYCFARGSRIPGDKSATPSGFTLKLRKHIRTRRLENVRQLGIDRPLQQKQKGPGGVPPGKGKGKGAKGDVPPPSKKGGGQGGGGTVEKDGKGGKWGGGTGGASDAKSKAEAAAFDLKWAMSDALAFGPHVCEHIILEAGLSPSQKLPTPSTSALPLPTPAPAPAPALAPSAAADRGGLDSAASKTGADDVAPPGLQESDVAELARAIAGFEDWLEELASGSITPQGFIIMQREGGAKGGKKKKNKGGEADDVKAPEGACKALPAADEAPGGPSQMYDEYLPLLLRQHQGREATALPTFDAALDEFYSKIEGQRAEQQRAAQTTHALSKLHKIRADQTKRAEQLRQEVDVSVRKAQLVEYNLSAVDAAISAVRGALAGGMDWGDLGRMIKEERRAGNPVAGIIQSLQLDKNQITLLLSHHEYDDMDDEQRTLPMEKVEVDLALSAYANARAWFDQKKRHAVKQEKTVAAHEKALKAAEKKTQQQLAQAKAVAAISHLRKVHWFEKFSWFVSAENYLVISGRDAQQNEAVVKRYLKKGDLYVHAELHGAASTVIKNHTPSQPIPPLTITQAGVFTVCRSAAWDSKIVTSAWWVHPHQVSKTAPTGEYLTAGSFMIRGRKNFLPPNPLVMGFGFLFRLDDSSLAAHLHERRNGGEGSDAGDEGEERGEGEEEGGAPEGEREGGEDESVEDREWVRATGVGADSNSDEGADEDANVDDEAGGGNADATPAGGTAGTTSEADAEDSGADRVECGEDLTAQQGGQEGDALEDLLDKAFASASSRSQTGVGVLSKYGLQAAPAGGAGAAADSEEEDEEGADGERGGGARGGGRQVAQRERPYVSKAERRRLKKGGRGGSHSDGPEKHAKEPEDLAGEKEEDEEEGSKGREGNASVAVTRKPGQDGSGAQGFKTAASRDGGGREGQTPNASRAGKKEGQSDKGEAWEGREDKKKQADKEEAAGSAGTVGSIKVARGKKGKGKKAKERYADQDEDERSLRLALLGSAGKKDEKPAVLAAETGGKADASTSGRQPLSAEQAQDMVCYNCKQQGHLARDCPSSSSSAFAFASASASTPSDGAPKQRPPKSKSKPASTSVCEVAPESTQSTQSTKSFQAPTSERAKGASLGGSSLVSSELGEGKTNTRQGGGSLTGKSRIADDRARGGEKVGEEGSEGDEEEEGEGQEPEARTEEEAIGCGEVLPASIAAATGGASTAPGGVAATKGGGEREGGISKRARARVADAEVAAILAEENVHELADDEKEKLTELDSLTGVPRADDVLLYAVPVCGPYSALQNYKYRVKLTPGSAKKGKAAKTAVDLFMRMPETTAREKELMKAVTDPEIIGAMIGNVKLTAPGLAKVMQSQKKGRKAAASGKSK
eukprot:jgi/Mesen1/2853/ME000174S02111